MIYYIKNVLAICAMIYILTMNKIIEKLEITHKIIEFNNKCKKKLSI